MLSVDQLLTVVTGTTGVSGILAVWLWSERKERIRLQRIVEGFLPLVAGTQRAMRAVTRVVGADEEQGG